MTVETQGMRELACEGMAPGFIREQEWLESEWTPITDILVKACGESWALTTGPWALIRIICGI